MNLPEKNAFIPLFSEKGLEMSFPNHYRLVLEDNDYVFFLEKGTANLFLWKYLKIPSSALYR